MRTNVLILKFPYSSTFGGGEKHLLTLVEQLQRRGLAFFLLSSCPVLLAEFRQRRWGQQKINLAPEPVAKWSIIIFLLFVPWILIRLLFKLILLRLRGFNVLYCLSLTEKIVITPWARLLGYRVVWQEHVSIKRWLTLNPYRIFYQLFSRLVKIVAVSESVKQELLDIKIPENNIWVIYSGLDLEQFTPHLSDTGDDTNTSPLKYPKDAGGAFVVGTIGRLVKEKGFEFLLQAVKIAQKFIPRLRLVIVGDGPERKNLEWLAHKLQFNQQVLFVGWQADPLKWLNNFDIFILPSVKRESFGLVLLEALALKKPVIASKLGGIPEIIQNKKTGLLVKPGNTEQLAQAIIDLHNNPDQRTALGEVGYELVKEKFTLEKMVEKYYQVLSR